MALLRPSEKPSKCGHNSGWEPRSPTQATLFEYPHTQLSEGSGNTLSIRGWFLTLGVEVFVKHMRLLRAAISTATGAPVTWRLPARSHPQQLGGFHLESSGLSLCNSGSGRAAAACCVSQTGVGGGSKTPNPQSKGSLNLVRLRVLCDGFEQLSFNLISWQKKKPTQLLYLLHSSGDSI